METYEFIDGYEKVIARFGMWPSFHDGEVHRIVLDRMNQSVSGSYIPTLEVYLRGWIMTSEVAETGTYKLVNDSIVHFLFENIFDFELEGFNNQNVLSSLNLSFVTDPQNSDQALRVELEHCYQFSSEFSARKAKILSVSPYINK